MPAKKKTVWQEKNVGVSLLKGKAHRKPVVDDRDGTVGGYEVEHWDDHQDAVVMPKSVRTSLKIREVE